MNPPVIDNLLVVGVGLIGGSLALALKRDGAVGCVTGFGRRRETLEQARALGVIDRIADDPVAAVAAADMVFLGVPVGAMKSVLQIIAPGIGPGTVVTDGGSTKCGPIAAAREVLGEKFPRFVPGHPIAGSERSGVAAARADLFDDHRVLLTPDPDCDADAIDRVATIWARCGARTDRLDAEAHDRVLGLTSHLPHVLAFTLVDFIARGKDAAQCFELAAGGFFDFTRIAGSDPVMWRDVASDNARNLGDALAEYIDVLQSMKTLIDQGRADDIEQVFANARRARGLLVDHRRGQTS